ncbi:hypothetical protein [Anaerocolumna sp. MB42-C2]|uniref:hypothetical protein n=1 Tax=Anaerocolumna sp. MB42-C2 TaxID=3070997 RepID=UPI0027E02B70|nr:hypothetical protein [Anaerocolumna sp. MB42-C2]WMJ86782.1 hypothetical protein RBU59_22495 [Anaerocolumna sp. MB42-C2]
MFRTMKCIKNTDTIILSKQLSFKPYSCLLPIQHGECIYTITVLEGKMRINHSAYNPDGGTWSCPPSNRQRQFYDLVSGETKEIKLTIDKNYNELDNVEVVNCSLTKPLHFLYSAHFVF